MQTISVENWEEFEARLQEIKLTVKAGHVGLLFRGQADASWSLSTTLERSRRTMERVQDYYLIIREIKPQLETFTNFTFDIPDFDEIYSSVRDYDAFSRRMSAGNLPGYRYMIYLRHHGFPTPLLDWSRSPYVAAYFAFAKATAANVSIYVFAEQPENIKVRGASGPAIYSFGPLVRSHRRHFLQQSTYTVCARFELPGGTPGSSTEWKFASHEDVFAQDDKHQDLLWKFVMPCPERLKVLRHLEEYNLNALSLFGTEESLMETLAIRVMDFRS
jgi:FRG domain